MPTKQRITELRQRLALPALLVLITILLRIPFRSDQVFLVDAVGFCTGAMTTLVSHPPGFIGYCLLGRLAYYVTHDVNLGFVAINIVCTGLTTGILYLLGERMFGKVQG